MHSAAALVPGGERAAAGAGGKANAKIGRSGRRRRSITAIHTDIG
jgi:hypothetical protein|eukprot:SAG25_NODE_172_length_13022_cov_64.797500_9_plen_45_part_00